MGGFLELRQEVTDNNQDFDVSGVFETAAHSKYATKSYLCAYLPLGWKNEDPEFERIKAECERFGIGLMYFTTPEDYAAYEILVEPKRRNPDPIDMDAGNRSADEVLYELVCRAYDVEWDDQNLRRGGATGDATARAAHFVSLRVNYPVRHEFTSYRIRLHHAPDELVKQVRDLGFQVIEA